jgi:hypothetical protein
MAEVGEGDLWLSAIDSFEKLAPRSVSFHNSADSSIRSSRGCYELCVARAVACVHAEPKTVPDRRFRRGVGLICAPYLALVRQDAPQCTHDLREVFDALRWIVRAGA